MSQGTPDPQAEFDAYAADYGAGMDVGMKRCLGANAESFLEVKAEWLRRDLVRRPLPAARASVAPAPAVPRLLDYGCGAGTFLHVLCKMNFSAGFAGGGVSAEM